MAFLDKEIAALGGRSKAVIPGDTVFKLYDTYGFPSTSPPTSRANAVSPSTSRASKPRWKRSAKRARGQQVQRRSARRRLDWMTRLTLAGTKEPDRRRHRRRVASRQGARRRRCARARKGEVVLDHTPFYAESGGQVGDAGALTGPGVRFVVDDTAKIGSALAHIGNRVKEGKLRVGARLEAHVDGKRRRATMALTIPPRISCTPRCAKCSARTSRRRARWSRRIVCASTSRTSQPVTPDELKAIEELVNAEIRANAPAETKVMGYDAAVAAGAMALFGEKYDKDVRVLRFGGFSMELCGGTHVKPCR